MPKKILTVGSLTFDFFATPARQKILTESSEKFLAVPFGGKVRAENAHRTFGGSASNCAANFAQFQIPVAAFGAVGADEESEAVLQNLQNRGIDSRFVQKIRGEKTGFSIILNSDCGERTVLFAKGANEKIEKIPAAVLSQFHGIHLGHLSGKSAAIFAGIEKFFGKNPDHFLSWNPGREQIEKGVEFFAKFLPAVDALFLNLEEAQKLSGEKKPPDIFAKLKRNNFRGILAVTDGRRGADIFSEKENFHLGIFEQFSRVDALGAGDAFASAASAQLFRGEKNLQKVFKIATISAASVVSKFGAQAGLLPEKKLRKLAESFDF